MKKYLSAILAFILITALLAGCGEKAPQAPNLNGVALNKYAIVYSDADTDYAQREPASRTFGTSGRPR